MPRKKKEEETNKNNQGISAQKPIKTWTQIFQEEKKDECSSSSTPMNNELIQQWISTLSQSPELAKALQTLSQP